MPLLVKNVRLVDPAQGIDGPGDLLIDEGKVVAIGSDAVSHPQAMGAEVRGLARGDLVVAPNLPTWGVLSIFRVTGAYAWDPMPLDGEDRFGHVLPVELLVKSIDRKSPAVSFKALADCIHAKGLKFGLHLMRGVPRQAVAQNAPILGTAFHADIADRTRKDEGSVSGALTATLPGHGAGLYRLSPGK